MEIEPDYGYVLIVLGLSWILNIFLSVQVSRARKLYKVNYPTLYASESHKNAESFNCIQRAHQNTLESWAPVQILMLVNGVFQPTLAATLGFLWVVGRFLYGIGYASSGPKGRMLGGAVSHLGDLPLFLMTFYNGGKLSGLL
eukprot:NODE_6677_length_545_cov_235.804435_g6256_i0.p1 GENE.NODE_6677_length_545_cov_235.804435_g6256_i0~~NODE_6677_length_545_cov_235.804435_g6256_i0.p1  ORF type:complete len:142 (+),score=2.25 NODE_6677_length_545_cov_235.804435_g6256_i0:63-488(+)